MLPRGRPQNQQYPLPPGPGYSMNYNQYPQNYGPQIAPHFNRGRRDRARPRNQYSYYSDESERSSFSINTQISRGAYMPRGGIGRSEAPTTVKLKKPTIRKQNQRPENPQVILQRAIENVGDRTKESGYRHVESGVQRENRFRRDNHGDFVQTTHYFCPKCEANFSFRYSNNKYVGKIPLILQCNHTMCQECIYQNLKNNKVNCSVCLNDSTLTQEQTPVCQSDMQTVFLPNFYILGAISYYKPLGGHLRNLENIAFVSTGSKKPHPLLPDPSDCCCFATCSKLATMFCPSCEGIYCSECCIVVHKSTKKLMSHEPIPRLKQKFSLKLENCGEHPTMQLEFLCKTCELVACCYCVLDKHAEHDRVPLYNLSTAEIEEFKGHQKTAETALKEVLTAQKKAARLVNFDTAPVKKEMRQYFVDAHGKLETLEKKLCDELEAFKATNRGLDNIQKSLEASAEELKQLVAFNADNVGDKKLNLRAALSKLRGIESIPRFLLNKNGQTEPLRFAVNNGIIDSLEDDLILEKCEDSEYKLVSEKELPQDYSFDPEESDSELNETISDIVKKFNQSIAISNSFPKVSDLPVSAASSLKSKKTTFGGTKKKEPIKIKRKPDMERVDIQHINSMDSFFMQFKSDQAKLEQLNKDIENYVKMGGAQLVPQPQLGTLYLALYINESANQNQKEQKWCRARLTEIKNGEHGPLYEFFFIDYGKTQIVDGNRVKDLPTFLMQKKPFAIESMLHNPMGVNWNKRAHYSLAKILIGKEVYMIEKCYNQGIYEVDLMIASSDGGVTSVTDLLLHAHASATPINDDVSNMEDSFSTAKEGYFPILKLFPNSTKFTRNQKEKVIIATVIDPQNIFVHMVQHQEVFKAMSREIKKFYKNVKSSVCIPIEGTYVIVEYKDPIRSNWHRAFIKSVDLNSNKVHVLLVDWGLNVVVPNESIRTMQESFTKLECQAVLVSLTHIAPYNKLSAWSPHATNFLQTYCRSQEVLKMVLQEIEPELEVVLFDVKGNVDICLNALMVENNLADSTGYISLKVNWPQFEAVNPEFTEEDGLMSSLLKKVDEQAGDDSEEDLSDVKKRQVDVVKVESPDLIWLKFLEYRDKEREMFRNLQIHYSQEHNTKEDWKVGELCVTEVGHEFARGKILEKVNDDYKVYLLDKVQDIVSPLDKIYILVDYFENYRQAVIKSHLANIRPAGDTGKWSSSSIEALQEIFIKNKRIYASKAPESVSDIQKKTLPVDMWYGRVIQGGPLDPDRVKFVSINKSLVKLGFAYNVPRPATPIPSTSKVEVEVHAPAEGDVKIDESSVEPQKASTEEVTATSSKSKIAKSEQVDISEEIKKEISNQTIDNSQLSLDNWSAIVDRELGETSVEINKSSQSEDKNPEESDAASVKSSETSSQHKNEVVIYDWLPPFRFRKDDFRGRVTCVESGGHMFLHEQELDEVYYKMEASMKQYFESNPPELSDHAWQPGDLCTIKFTDGNWYRGKVLKKLSNEEVSVLMVDFGSDHNVSPDDLFREVLFTEISPFATKVKLDKVYSKSKTWLTSDYDNFHNLVTDWCRIVIQGPIDVEQPLVDVYNEHGVYVNQKLVELCPNLSRCSNFPIQGVEEEEEDPVVIESLEADEPYDDHQTYDMDVLNEEPHSPYDVDQITALQYRTQSLPQDFLDGEKIIMEIGGVLNFDRIVLRLPEAVVSGEIYDLIIDLQDAVDGLPNLKEFVVGTPCLAPFSEDEVWYRARITGTENVDDEVVDVMFVDYGNSEAVPIKDVKVIRPDHLVLPQQSWEASVNVTLNDKDAFVDVMQFIKSLEGKKKYVKLVKLNPLSVDLYEKNDTLCYDDFISSGVLKRLEDAISP